MTVPFAWVACERPHGYGDLGFPWRTLGYSLTSSPFIVQFADLAGVFGISFWLVLLNTQLYEAWKAPRELTSQRRYLLACCLVLVAAAVYDALRCFSPLLSNESREVAVIQPNVPQRIK